MVSSNMVGVIRINSSFLAGLAGHIAANANVAHVNLAGCKAPVWLGFNGPGVS